MVAPVHPEPTGTVIHHTLHSSIVNDDYDIFVRLPSNFDSTGKVVYPVIFQLDATLGILDEFNTMCGFVSDQEENSGASPTIIVGIGYPYEQGSGNGRNRDFTLPARNGSLPDGATGGAPAFYRFIKNELLPYITSKYPIADASGRALSGHSFGGLFTLYAFLQNDTSRPFSNYIAASPSIWYDGGSLYEYIDTFALYRASTKQLLYTSIGDLEGPGMVVYFDNFTSRIQNQSFANVLLETQHFSTNHLGSISPSFRDGSRFLYTNGFKGTTK